jgi:Flp pilus assembly protein TadG
MIRRLAACGQGTSMVEFALLAPVFIFLLIGIVDVGRYTYYGIMLAHSARAGVQYGAQNLTTAADAGSSGPATTAAAKQDAPGLSNLTVTSSVVCSVNNQPSPCPSANNNAVSSTLVYYVKVTVSGTFNALIRYPGIPSSIPVSGLAMMRVGNQ